MKAKAPLMLLGVAVGLAFILVISGAGLRTQVTADNQAVAAMATATPAAEADAATGQLVLHACGGCHGLSTLSQHPQDAAAWSKTVASMEQLGAQVPQQQEQDLIAYLAQHFGPQ
ncbi:MAG: hypothetical protein ACRD1A_04190 [Terriglobales bacterium]